MELNLEQDISKEVVLTEKISKEGMIVTASYDGKFATVSLNVEVKLIDMLEKMAADTENKIDDTLVALVKAAL